MMRLVVILLTTWLCIGCTQQDASPKAPSRLENVLRELSDPESQYIMVLAHRGCWKRAPENSIPALEACIAMGVDIVEIDVRLTKDGVPVVVHDATLERTTQLIGKVGETSLAELSNARLRAGQGGPDAKVTMHPLPTLLSLLRAAKGGILVNIDVKDGAYDEIALIVTQTGTESQVILKRRTTVTDGALVDQRPFSQVIAMPIIDQKMGEIVPLIEAQLDPAPQLIELIFVDRDIGMIGAKKVSKPGSTLCNPDSLVV